MRGDSIDLLQTIILRETDIQTVLQSINALFSPGKSTGSKKTDIFILTIKTTDALIRLRRDLVLSCMPMFTPILQQMILCFRSLPEEALQMSKRRDALDRILPYWLSASSPLISQDAKAFSRLLNGILVKTIPLTIHKNPSNALLKDSEPAQDLRKPFSKQAIHVLITYVKMLGSNDHLATIVSGPIRQELLPGMIALCETINEHERDAALSKLESLEVQVFKNIWQSYTEQRYSGRG